MHVQIGDIVLNYEITGSGSPLVLTHGLGNTLHFWDAVCESFAAHHTVVRWDVRGFGASDKPPGPYSPALFAGDLLGLLDHLAIARAHLLGLSMGGVITQRFALDHPERVRSLVLVSTSSEIGPRGTANWQRLADAVEQRGFGAGARDASRSFSPGFVARHPEVVAAMGEETAANEPRAYAAAARAMSEYHWTADLARLQRPVLILQGLDDQLTPPGGSVKMSRALPARRLLMIPEAGHNLPIEQPELFKNTVLAFAGGVDACADVGCGP